MDLEHEIHASNAELSERAAFLAQLGSREKNGLIREKVPLEKCPDAVPVKISFWQGYSGIILTLVHVICFSLAALAVKMLKDFHPFSIGVFRFQGLLYPSMIMLCSQHIYNVNRSSDEENINKIPESIFSNIWPLTAPGNLKRVLLLTIRCFTGTTAILLFFYSLHFISVADTMVITSASPVFVTLMAYFCLNEPCGIFPVILSILTIGGVVIISRPPILTGAEEFDTDTLIGSALGVASMFLTCFAFVIIRYLKDIHVGIISAAFGLWGTAQSLISSLIIGVLHVPHETEHILLTIAVALLTFLAQISLTSALKREDAGPVSLVRTTNVVFGFVWQFIFLGVNPDRYSVVGASIVLFGVVGSAFRKWVGTLSEDHSIRRKLSWFLK